MLLVVTSIIVITYSIISYGYITLFFAFGLDDTNNNINLVQLQTRVISFFSLIPIIINIGNLILIWILSIKVTINRIWYIIIIVWIILCPWIFYLLGTQFLT
jgi:hypothetical protein